MRTVGVNALMVQDRPWPEIRALFESLPGVAVGLSSTVFWRQGWEPLQQQLAGSGLDVRSIGSALTTPADAEDRTRLRRELDRLLRTIDTAAALGTPTVGTTTGPAGRLCWEDALARRQEDLAPALEHARRAGVRLTVENTHSLRSDVSFLHTLRDTVHAARVLGTGVCADLYCCWAERGLAETLVDGVDVITTVQYADFVHGTLTQPNRWVPGDGDLPLDELVAAVVASGCTGWQEIELVGPEIDREGPQRAAGRAAAWLRDRLDALDAPSPGASAEPRSREQRLAATRLALRR